MEALYVSIPQMEMLGTVQLEELPWLTVSPKQSVWVPRQIVRGHASLNILQLASDYGIHSTCPLITHSLILSCTLLLQKEHGAAKPAGPSIQLPWI